MFYKLLSKAAFKGIFFISLFTIGLLSKAQDKKFKLEIDYTTELQYNFQQKTNWVNLLTIESNYNIWANGVLTLQTISTYKANNTRIVNDLQAFSNIEADKMFINLATLGYTHSFGNFSLFGGVRNINRDYFTSNYTSLYTNSSCGIYPTISANFPLANFPLSSMCLHSEYKTENIVLKSSIYNGEASKIFQNTENVFAIHPDKDGFLTINELGYLSQYKKYGFYSIGFALFYNNLNTNENNKINYALWGNIEQAIFKSDKHEIGIMLQSSFAPSNMNDCKQYYGLGTIFKGFISSKKQDCIGLMINRAIYKKANETAIEFTWQYLLFKNLTIQPVLDYIITGNQRSSIGIFRAYYTFK